MKTYVFTVESLYNEKFKPYISDLSLHQIIFFQEQEDLCGLTELTQS